MFKTLVGNEEIKKLLIESIKSNNISHSYIFNGIQGVGKKLFAREYAKNIMCLQDGDCDNTCDSCIKFEAKSNPDYYEIEPDGKTLKIEQIRKMQEKIAEKPIISNRKVYIIDDADMMTEESQNCLLKTLEEPPEYAIIILIVSNENKLLATIKSRCVTIKFNKISEQELQSYLTTFSDEQIKLLNGSFQNMDTISERQEEYQNIVKIVDIMRNGNKIDLIENSEMLYTQKENIMDILDYLNIVLLENKIIQPIEYVEKTKRKILANNNYEMSIDYLLINSWNSIHK